MSLEKPTSKVGLDSEGILSPRVSVMIVTYRSTEELPGCMDSVLNQPVPVEVFVVDNASGDDTPAMVAGFGARFPNVHPILNEENVGLAAGNNAAIGRMRGEYALMLNPDTLLHKDTLERMVRFMDENQDIGVIGPKNVFENGEPHVSFDRHWGLFQIVLWRALPYKFARWLHDGSVSYEQQDVLFVSGSCLLIRRSIFEQIGGYDPEYFLTIEDVVDLCIRAKKTGARVVFFPGAEVVHFNGRSGAQVPYIAVWNTLRGSAYHFYKHGGLFVGLVASFMLITITGARVVLESILGIFSARYRRAVGPYARVFWSLIVRNPIWTRN